MVLAVVGTELLAGIPPASDGPRHCAYCIAAHFQQAGAHGPGAVDEPLDALVYALTDVFYDFSDLVADAAQPYLIGEEADHDGHAAGHGCLKEVGRGFDVALCDLYNSAKEAVDHFQNGNHVLDGRLHSLEEGDEAVDDGHDARGVKHAEELDGDLLDDAGDDPVAGSREDHVPEVAELLLYLFPDGDGTSGDDVVDKGPNTCEGVHGPLDTCPALRSYLLSDLGKDVFAGHAQNLEDEVEDGLEAEVWRHGDTSAF